MPMVFYVHWLPQQKRVKRNASPMFASLAWGQCQERRLTLGSLVFVQIATQLLQNVNMKEKRRQCAADKKKKKKKKKKRQ